MVERLRSSPYWPAGELPVDMIQTHISIVLLGRQHVLKLKKPVDFGFLDYTTLEKRRLACEAEINLNRRLCPDAYIGVQVIREADGRLTLSEDGSILDYGVLMKRLPDDFMLDRLIARDEVTESMIDRVADRLGAFHREARRGPDIDKYGEIEMIRANWEENFTQTSSYIDRTIRASEFDTIRTWVNNWIEVNKKKLSERVRESHICDGHGDVRSESICITNGICIFDCIEFNERFRYTDVASEVAFLAMDIDARGRPDLGYYFAERYQARTGDGQLFDLLPFYRCYRAYVRGKVLSFRLDESEFSKGEREAAATRARSYFHLAHRYAAPLDNPTVIIVTGLSGTGKTSLARAIAGEMGLRVVSADAVRKSIFEMGNGEYEYGEGPYSSQANRITYEKMIEIGKESLKKYGGVVLDATFRRTTDRAMAREMALKAGANLRFIECKLSPESVRLRLEKRALLKEGLSDATWTTYSHQRNEFKPLEDLPSREHLVVDTTGSLSVTSHSVCDWLRENDATDDLPIRHSMT